MPTQQSSNSLQGQTCKESECNKYSTIFSEIVAEQTGEIFFSKFCTQIIVIYTKFANKRHRVEPLINIATLRNTFLSTDQRHFHFEEFNIFPNSHQRKRLLGQNENYLCFCARCQVRLPTNVLILQARSCQLSQCLIMKRNEKIGCFDCQTKQWK